jgi:hypothetical protein
MHGGQGYTANGAASGYASTTQIMGDTWRFNQYSTYGYWQWVEGTSTASVSSVAGTINVEVGHWFSCLVIIFSNFHANAHRLTGS